MEYKIIGDSCMDLPENLKNDPHFARVPLTIHLESKQFEDDESLDREAFMTSLKNAPQNPQTACPSPMTYLKSFDVDARNIFVITLSSSLSGSYQSAMIAKSIYDEEHRAEEKKILIIDSESASAGQARIALFIRQLCEQNLLFEDIINKVVKFRDGMKTYFVLESLDALRKSGRLSGLKEKIISVLNIKLVMGSHKGQIMKILQERGIHKTLQRMCETIASEVENIKDKVPVISHINNLERAEFVKNEILKRCGCKEAVIVDGGGISTVYAGNGGIILAI